jgi:hypothetical protein
MPCPLSGPHQCLQLLPSPRRGARDFLRLATQRKEHVPAACRRAIHVQRVAALRDMLAIA